MNPSDFEHDILELSFLELIINPIAKIEQIIRTIIEIDTNTTLNEFALELLIFRVS